MFEEFSQKTLDHHLPTIDDKLVKSRIQDKGKRMKKTETMDRYLKGTSAIKYFLSLIIFTQIFAKQITVVVRHHMAHLGKQIYLVGRVETE